MSPSPSLPADALLRATRERVLSVLSVRIEHAHTDIAELVDDWISTPDGASFEARWDQLLEDHGIADATEWMTCLMRPGTGAAMAPTPPSPTAGDALMGGDRRPGWRGYLEIVMCSISSTLVATAAGIALIAWLPDTLTRTALATAASMVGAWMADQWLCRVLIQQEASRRRAHASYRDYLIDQCHGALARIHTRLQFWAHYVESAIPQTIMDEDIISRTCQSTHLWQRDLVSALLAHATTAWERTSAPRSASDACDFLQQVAAQSIGTGFTGWRTDSCMTSPAKRNVAIETIGTVCMETLREVAMPPQRTGKLADFANLAMSPVAGILELLAGKTRNVARGLFAGFRYLGWQSPEAQWLRHASTLAKGSGMLASIAPMIATALDVYVRVKAHRLARAQARHVRKLRRGLREAIRKYPSALAARLPACATIGTVAGATIECSTEHGAPPVAREEGPGMPANSRSAWPHSRK